MQETHLFPNVVRPVRGVESHSTVEKHCLKVNGIVNRRVCKFLKWILSEHKSLHEFFEKKADRVFEGKFEVQIRLSEALAELDTREWERRSADIALHGTGRQIGSQRMELYLANQLSDQAQRDKSWRFEELVFQ